MSDPFDTLRIRPGEPGDRARVLKDFGIGASRSTFAHFCTPRPGWGLKASQLYWDWQKAIMQELLARADLWIACWEEAPSTIVGWALMESGDAPVVHWVTVLPSYRRHHVAKRLLAPAFEHRRVLYSYQTSIVKNLPVPPGWSFDPSRALVVPVPMEKAA